MFHTWIMLLFATLALSIMILSVLKITTTCIFNLILVLILLLIVIRSAMDIYMELLIMAFKMYTYFLMSQDLV